MAAPKGNRFWEARSSHGRKPIFETPEQLWNAASEYFKWVEDNPLYEDHLVTYQGAVKHEPKARMRAMTITGLCTFLDITLDTWHAYKAKDGFFDVTRAVEQIIRDQKFAGAAAEMLNPNIIARDLGLAEKNEHAGPEGGPIQTEVSARDIIRDKLAGLAARKSARGDTGEPDGSAG